MKAKRFVIASDSHGSEIDPLVETKFFDWLKDWNPEIRVHAGDLWDFSPLRNGASQEDKAQSMVADYDAGTAFAKRFFAGGDERHFLRGNHDERLWDLRHKSEGVLRDFAEQKTGEIENRMRQWGVRTYPYDARLGVCKIGHLQVIHGFRTGVGAARAHATIYRNCVYGHTHDQGIAPVENLDGPALAMGTGCLCAIDMAYNARQTNKLRHQQGWVYGMLYRDGTYQAFHAKRIGDSIHCATGIQTY